MLVPTWVKRFCARWGKSLGIEPEVSLRMTMTPDETDANTMAACSQYPNRNRCIIDLRADAENTLEWRQYILHEILHCGHMRVDYVVEKVIGESLPPEARKIAMRAYDAAMESYIDRMASALVGMDGKGSKHP